MFLIVPGASQATLRQVHAAMGPLCPLCPAVQSVLHQLPNLEVRYAG